MDIVPRAPQRENTVSARRRRWIACRPWAVVTIAGISLTSFGCASRADSDAEVAAPLAKVCPEVFGGTVDDDSEAIDAVVEIDIGDPRDPKLCTGALIAPNVVLTARHCVSIAPNKNMDCYSDGSTKEKEGHITDDVAPEDIHVVVGALPGGGRAYADGVMVYHAEGTNLCNQDIAAVVLDHTLDGVTPLAVGVAPKASSSIRVTGYGKNDIGCALGTRIRKDAVKVLAIGPARSSSGVEVGSHEFDVQRSFCDGDSGGPAIDEATGAVVGVVSHGRDCSRDGGHVYTSLAGFTDLLDRALKDGATRAAER